MFDQFVEYIANAHADEVRALTVEDMAVCVAWFQSYANDPVKQEACAGLQEATELWVAGLAPHEHESEGSRQQPLLRALVDELQDGRLEQLKRDELDFLCIVYDLMQRADGSALFERPSTVLAPHIEVLQARRSALALAPGLPAVSKRICIVMGEHIEAARSREIRLLAGIKLPGRGPVFSYKGNLKVLDYVPENCTVVVEQGACYVSGFVMGKVVAAKHCEVRENISGVTIVTQGDIRVRNIINKAVVISKLGRVRCRSAEEPKLVFAGESIWIGESAVGGRYVSPRMEVAEEVVSGEVNVSESLTAKRFRSSRVSGLSIVLRRELSCEDYGEEIGLDGRRLMAQRAELRRRLHSLKHMIALAEEESEHHATSALMFLWGGEKTKHLLEEIQFAQRRLAFLDRIIAGLKTLREIVESNLAVSASSRLSQTEPLGEAGGESRDSIQDIERELAEIESEGEIDADLSEKREEMLAMGQDLNKSVPYPNLAAAFLGRLQQKESTWLMERDELTAAVEAKGQDLLRLAGRMELLDQAGEDASRVQLLVQLLALAKKRRADRELASRVQASIVRLMLRAVNARIERARNYKESVAEVRRELDEVNTRLYKGYQIATTDEDAPPVVPRATGCFDARVRVYAGRFPLDRPDAPPGAVLVTPNSHGRVVTYVRENQSIVEAQ